MFPFIPNSYSPIVTTSSSINTITRMPGQLVYVTDTDSLYLDISTTIRKAIPLNISSAFTGTLSTSGITQTVLTTPITLNAPITLHNIARTGSWSDLLNKPTIPSAFTGTLQTSSTGQSVISTAISTNTAITLHNVARTGNYDDLLNKPTTPAAFTGTLITSATTQAILSTAISTNSAVTLHNIARTGSYNDLLNKPTIPDVSGFVTLGTEQIISGRKTFSNSITTFLGEIYIDGNNDTIRIAGLDSYDPAIGVYQKTASTNYIYHEFYRNGYTIVDMAGNAQVAAGVISGNYAIRVNTYPITATQDLRFRPNGYVYGTYTISPGSSTAGKIVLTNANASDLTPKIISDTGQFIDDYVTLSTPQAITGNKNFTGTTTAATINVRQLNGTTVYGSTTTAGNTVANAGKFVITKPSPLTDEFIKSDGTFSVITLDFQSKAPTGGTWIDKQLAIVNGNWTEITTSGAFSGTLQTSSTGQNVINTAISTNSAIILHNIARTGNYNDLLNKPTIPNLNDVVTKSGTDEVITGRKIFGGMTGAGIIVDSNADGIRVGATGTTGTFSQINPGIIRLQGTTITDGGSGQGLIFSSSNGSSTLDLGTNSAATGMYGTATTALMPTNAGKLVVTKPGATYSTTEFIKADGSFATPTGGTTGDFVTLDTNQTISGQKTFIAATTYFTKLINIGDSGDPLFVTINANTITFKNTAAGTTQTLISRTDALAMYGTATTAGSTVQNAGKIVLTKPNPGNNEFIKADGTFAVPSTSSTFSGTLQTSATTQSKISTATTLDAAITLHDIARTGNWSDLLNRPTIPDVSNFVTLNTTQTITGEKIFKNKQVFHSQYVPERTIIIDDGSIYLTTELGNASLSITNTASSLVYGTATTAGSSSYDAGKLVVANNNASSSTPKLIRDDGKFVDNYVTTDTLQDIIAQKIWRGDTANQTSTSLFINYDGIYIRQHRSTWDNTVFTFNSLKFQPWNAVHYCQITPSEIGVYSNPLGTSYQETTQNTIYLGGIRASLWNPSALIQSVALVNGTNNANNRAKIEFFKQGGIYQNIIQNDNNTGLWGNATTATSESLAGKLIVTNSTASSLTPKLISDTGEFVDNYVTTNTTQTINSHKYWKTASSPYTELAIYSDGTIISTGRYDAVYIGGQSGVNPPMSIYNVPPAVGAGKQTSFYNSGFNITDRDNGCETAIRNNDGTFRITVNTYPNTTEYRLHFKPNGTVYGSITTIGNISSNAGKIHIVNSVPKSTQISITSGNWTNISSGIFRYTISIPNIDIEKWATIRQIARATRSQVNIIKNIFVYDITATSIILENDTAIAIDLIIDYFENIQ